MLRKRGVKRSFFGRGFPSSVDHWAFEGGLLKGLKCLVRQEIILLRDLLPSFLSWVGGRTWALRFEKLPIGDKQVLFGLFA
jgi:hypothetical protein